MDQLYSIFRFTLNFVYINFAKIFFGVGPEVVFKSNLTLDSRGSTPRGSTLPLNLDTYNQFAKIKIQVLSLVRPQRNQKNLPLREIFCL